MRNSNFDAAKINAFLMGDFLYKNDVSDNFPWLVYYNKSCLHM